MTLVRTFCMTGRRSASTTTSAAVSNWGGNIEFGHMQLAMPETMDELQDIVRSADTLRVLGSTHSFNDIADNPDGTLVSLAFLRDGTPSLNVDNMTVTCHGGTTYGQLARFLGPRGAALSNMPSLPHITVAGAIATGTHGSGLSFGNMGTQVAGLEVVRADGEMVKYTRDEAPHHLEGATASLGLLGVTSRITLDIVPAFNVTQTVYRDVSLASYLSLLHDVNCKFQSVSAFIDFKHESVEVLWLRSFHEDFAAATDPERTELRSQLAGGRAPDTDPVLFFESGHDVKTSWTGPWDLVLPFFTTTSSSGGNGPPVSGSGIDVGMPNEALHAEFFLDVADAIPALQAVRDVAMHWPGWGAWDGVDKSTAGPVIMSEIRFVRGDTHWLSPCRGRDSICIHFTFNADVAAVMPLVGGLEAVLAPFRARPHWGKLYTASPDELSTVYADEDSQGDASLKRFEGLRKEMDPYRKFSSSPFVRRSLPAQLAPEKA